MRFWNREKYWLWSYSFLSENGFGFGRGFIRSNGHVNLVRAESDMKSKNNFKAISTISLIEISKATYDASIAELEKERECE